ncbi:hypothetical protein RhiirA4_39767 [Rhizophagus irregularis]|uniref:Uncharacterized protein n=1 Tax=Rhizophagus irregularis TaxID=588596 RepID=A0A2I1G3J9_9GLOM|nr:hypothetical protein RhiirA4_39767 [Rhizophagus irregularis]
MANKNVHDINSRIKICSNTISKYIDKCNNTVSTRTFQLIQPVQNPIHLLQITRPSIILIILHPFIYIAYISRGAKNQEVFKQQLIRIKQHEEGSVKIIYLTLICTV